MLQAFININVSLPCEPHLNEDRATDFLKLQSLIAPGTTKNLYSGLQERVVGHKRENLHSLFLRVNPADFDSMSSHHDARPFNTRSAHNHSYPFTLQL
jgi:hypothetical protein